MHASGAVTMRTAASLNIVQRRRGRGGGNRLFSPDEARSDRGGGGGGAQSLTVTTAAGGGQRPPSIAWRASERARRQPGLQQRFADSPPQHCIPSSVCLRYVHVTRHSVSCACVCSSLPTNSSRPRTTCSVGLLLA